MWGGPPSYQQQHGPPGGYGAPQQRQSGNQGGGGNPLLSLLDATKGHVLQQSYGSFQGSGGQAPQSTAPTAPKPHVKISGPYSASTTKTSGPYTADGGYGGRQPSTTYGQPPHSQHGYPPQQHQQQHQPVIGPQMVYNTPTSNAGQQQARTQPLLNKPHGEDGGQAPTSGGSKTKQFVGRVTSKLPLYGFVDEDVFFQDSTVMGGRVPATGDEVGVTAEYNESLPMKWNAVAVCLSRTKAQIEESEGQSRATKEESARQADLLKKAQGEVEQLKQQQAMQSAQLAKTMAELGRVRGEMETREAMLKQIEQRQQSAQMAQMQELQIARQTVAELDAQLVAARQQADAANAQAHAIAARQQQSTGQSGNVVQQLFGGPSPMDSMQMGGGGLLGDAPNRGQQQQQPQQPLLEAPDTEDRATLQIQRQALMDQVLTEAARSGQFQRHEMQTAENQLHECLNKGTVPRSPLAQMMLEKMYQRMAEAGGTNDAAPPKLPLLPSLLDDPPPQPLHQIDTRTARDIVELFGGDGKQRGPPQGQRGGPPNVRGGPPSKDGRYSGRSSSPFKPRERKRDGEDDNRTRLNNEPRSRTKRFSPVPKRHRGSSPSQPGARIRSPSPQRDRAYDSRNTASRGGRTARGGARF